MHCNRRQAPAPSFQLPFWSRGKGVLNHFMGEKAMKVKVAIALTQGIGLEGQAGKGQDRFCKHKVLGVSLRKYFIRSREALENAKRIATFDSFFFTLKFSISAQGDHGKP